MSEERELKINQQLRKVSIDQEDKRREIRELEDLESDYFSIHQQEQRYYQDLIGNNQGSRYTGHFMELDNEANRLHQYERQRLEDIAERLVSEEVQLRDKEEELYAERTQLFAEGDEAEDKRYGY
ncbi:hypothetical protein A5821_000096 [Enterococcus sp. 7F3_DIV0205]|uniref:Uncharacterized protein n=1 Tax=Candidatus Enterococcus palustris TaxID=1834189 RepID=A0AAQ3Y6I8_9ENTE|nr:DUF3958 family protein [Enterococcus sp. 7F3_DIV0205]OTN84502.1 hypothetical protein A5821_000430 [Enterococcus sp. 7F3_DIV0205]